jgi:hypothetical protein
MQYARMTSPNNLIGADAQFTLVFVSTPNQTPVMERHVL